MRVSMLRLWLERHRDLLRPLLTFMYSKDSIRYSYIYVRETYLYVTETYMSVKETYVFVKETFVFVHMHDTTFV